MRLTPRETIKRPWTSIVKLSTVFQTHRWYRIAVQFTWSILAMPASRSRSKIVRSESILKLAYSLRECSRWTRTTWPPSVKSVTLRTRFARTQHSTSNKRKKSTKCVANFIRRRVLSTSATTTKPSVSTTTCSASTATTQPLVADSRQLPLPRAIITARLTTPLARNFLAKSTRLGNFPSRQMCQMSIHLTSVQRR